VAQAARRSSATNEEAMEVLDLKAMAEQAVALHRQGKLDGRSALSQIWRPIRACSGRASIWA
jgi:hypothetical protein